MSGKSSRTKGAAAEREFAALMNEFLQSPTAFTRNLVQTREGGHDLVTDYPVAIEVKRQERTNLPAWVRQAREQAAGKPGTLPVVAYRSNREDWTVLVVMSVEEFGAYLQEQAEEI